MKFSSADIFFVILLCDLDMKTRRAFNTFALKTYGAFWEICTC